MATITAKQAVLWLLILLPLMPIPLVILIRKRCTVEINVIWYAFSLIFVIWWSINAAIAFSIIDFGTSLRSFIFSADHSPSTGQYFYGMARKYLTDVEAELGLVAAVLIIAIAPQLLTYILSGLSGCASTPKLVWQFEKIAIWSLIKFLSALGGFFVAEAVNLRYFDAESFDAESLVSNLEALNRGLTSVGIAFVVTVLQVYFLELAQLIGQEWRKRPNTWPYRLHRFFTRNLPKE